MNSVADSASLMRKQHWLEFYDLASPRRQIFLIRYAPELPVRPLPNPERRKERLEWIWQNYEYHMERMIWLDDDTIPCLDMLTGTEIFAEAFGSPVYRPHDNNPFALPCVQNAAEADRLRIPSLDAPPLALVFKMADELAKRAGPGAIFRLVDLQSPVDVAALIWEKTDFYTAFLKNPASVSMLVEKIKALQFAFLDEWFRRYGQEFIAHYPEYYMPYGATLSVDEIGAVSQKMFIDFFLPDLNQFAARYGALGIHSCAHARHQWSNFKQISGLCLLNINAKIEILQQAFSFFADFTPQWHYILSPEPVDPLVWLKEAPAQAHIVLDFAASSRESALRISEQIRSYNE